MVYQANLKPIITNEDQDILVYYSRVPVFIINSEISANYSIYETDYSYYDTISLD
jgi:hypothetical protein